MKSKNLSEKILRLIKSKGFNNIELDPVIETKYILQRSGENFKRLLFSFYDLNGKELCLRPDLTCLLYTSPSPRDGLLSRMPSSA